LLDPLAADAVLTGPACSPVFDGTRTLHEFASGNGLTDAGIPLIHDRPVLKTWQGGAGPFACDRRAVGTATTFMDF
jgi:hypothetical protein